MPGALASIDVEYVAGHEVRGLEVEDGVDDIADFSHPANRMHCAQCFVGLGRMHGGLDDAGSDRIDANASFREFDGERLGNRIQATLCYGGESSRYAATRLIDQARGDVHDVAGTLLQHLGGSALGHVKEAGDVDAHIVRIVVLGDGLETNTPEVVML